MKYTIKHYSESNPDIAVGLWVLTNVPKLIAACWVVIAIVEAI